VADRIDVVVGPAAITLAEFEPSEPIDFVFIDADKPGYRIYFESLVTKMRSGGVMVFDNSLYFGAVVTGATDADVVAIREVNDLVAADPRVETVLLNVGDGLLMARVV
jgi:caffeoyl-CoA O-methyltransferase